VTIERVDAGALDAATAEQMAEAANAANAADRLDIPPTTGPSVATLARYTSDNRPLDALWLVRAGSGAGRDGRIAAWAYLELPSWDNTHSAYVSCVVHPGFHDRGIGMTLLERQVAESRATGRTLLITFGPKRSSRIQFLLEHGFAVAQASAQRRLEPKLTDYSRIEAIATEAASAAKDYELVKLDGTTPESMMAAMRTLLEAINDAPLDDADLEPDVFPAERVRNYEAAMAARGQRVYRLLARHRQTGDLVGLTILCVDELRPGLAFQEDTSVVRGHRGHRLGLLLKARMLLWMRDQHPELRRIDTFNAITNEHMIRVNEELGASFTSESCLLQRHLS
jgi:GNAT superfamily N-acetyltransferase